MILSTLITFLIPFAGDQACPHDQLKEFKSLCLCLYFSLCLSLPLHLPLPLPLCPPLRPAPPPPIPLRIEDNYFTTKAHTSYGMSREASTRALKITTLNNMTTLMKRITE
jgi:hypothetical protein